MSKPLNNSPLHAGDAQACWYPLAASSDLVPRHVFHGQLLGREFAVWRADDGNVNVWENRCLHRGVRLSIGINDGRELVCQYHGWRYANRTAGCTYMPAHPADAPARTICNNTYPAVERYGLVWSCCEPQGANPVIPAIPEHWQQTMVLRAMPVNAPLATVASALSTFSIAGAAPFSIESTNEYTINCRPADAERVTLVFFLQPVDSHRTVIRGVVPEVADTAERLQTLQSFNHALHQLRETIEAGIDVSTLPAPMVAPIKPVSEALASMPALSGRKAPLRLVVAARENVATDVVAFELRSNEGELPTFQPGAHIDLHLGNGLVRQYSLTNKPGQTDCFLIAVKREADSSGGSDYLHDQLRQGDVLAVSVPRNNFPLRRDAVNTVLIAGGIGVTPLLSMAQTLQHSQLPFALHYFVRDQSHAVHQPLLQAMGNSCQLHSGLNADDTATELRQILAGFQPATHAYICGPAPMLSLAREIAAELHWPDESVHFEFFKNTETIDQSGTFKVELARSGLSLDVPSGKSLLETLRENGVDLPSSCEQGACGTCRISVLSGETLHQDVYLNDAERSRGDCIMSCVSRAKSATLVLDI